MTTATEAAASGFVRASGVWTLSGGKDRAGHSAWADSLWWRNGRIQAIGRAERLDREVPRSVPRHHLPNSWVLPGFVDGHTHFAMWALGQAEVRLAGSRTREEAVARVAAAEPIDGWVIGQGWDANGWAAAPDRAALDPVQPGPVFLSSLDVHAAWVNSAALSAAGITRGTADPPGGRIVRDASGEPTGLLLERAVELVRAVLPSPSSDRLRAALLHGQRSAHRLGITGIHDVEDLRVLRALQSLEGSGELRLRVLFHPPVASLAELIRTGVTSGQGSEWLSIGGVKIFLDGSLGSRTAWMLAPYERSQGRGMELTAMEEAAGAMRTAAAAGLATTAHAIGDAAVRRALTLLSDLPRLSVPHRIEHFQCVHSDDVERAARAGIVASMQPAHLHTDIPLVEEHWGTRGAGAYAFRSLLASGTSLVFGSDTPVATLDPREGIYAAVARRDAASGRPWHPHERLRFDEAIVAYTSAPAHAAGLLARRGTLAPGQDADLVAWEVDSGIEAGDAESFRRARAVLTVVGGHVVMQQSGD